MVLFNKKVGEQLVDVLIERKATNLKIGELAIENAIGMIAKTISKSEFKIYRKVKKKIVEEKGHQYYTLNIKPNVNETATVFWFNAIRKMFLEGKALIVCINDQLFLANSFDCSEIVLTESVFSNVEIYSNGNTYRLNKVFKRSECIYLENPNKRVVELIDIFNEEYASYVQLAVNGYRNSSIGKFSLKVPTQLSIKQADGKIVTSNDYAETIKQKLKTDETEITVLPGQIDLDRMNKDVNKNGDDIVKLTDTVFNYTAFSFDIPIDVFIGKTTEKSNAQNDYITFSIEPIIEIINDALNSFYFTENEYLSGEKIEIDKTSIKHYDILDVANNLDKLFAIGFSHNDICRFVGLNTVDEAWADERHVTKNYGTEKGGGSE